MTRQLHRLRARLGGYFWLPCDVCGRPFGGHEKPNGRLLTGPGRYRLTCPRCPHAYVRRDGTLYRAEVVRDDTSPNGIAAVLVLPARP